MPVSPSDSTCFCLHHLLKHPGSIQAAVMCDNASPGWGTCACATPPHRYGGLVGASWSPGTCGRRCLGLMGGQKELQGTPSDHAAVGLEPCLLFEPIEIVIEPCHEGQRQPYIDNGRRLPWRAADTALWRRCCLDWGHLLGRHCHHPALRWGHTVLLLREGAYMLFYHINYYCGIKYL